MPKINQLTILIPIILVFLTRSDTAAGPCPDANPSANLPHEVKLQHPGQYTQDDFDCFSWRSLVALNWAAATTGRGLPDRSKPFGQFGDNGLLTWQTYKEPYEVFHPGGASPCPGCNSDPECLKRCWNKAQELPKACMGIGVNEARITGALDAFQQAVPNVWLTDQNRNIVRYEIRLNEDEFNYIVANGFYNSAAQLKVTKDFKFPMGENGGKVGAIELKSAWRILTGYDDKRRYLAQDIVIRDYRLNKRLGVEDPINGEFPTCNKPGEGPCCVRTMGLVGFHIAHKVKGMPQWVWSTFEQVDNAPIQGQPRDPSVQYSFFDASCPAGEQRWVPNQNPRTAGLDITVPVQVERVLQKNSQGQPEPLLPKPVNDQWRQIVAGTVWENYVLVSTQWPFEPGTADPAGRNQGTPDPEFLANTVLETYIQSNDPDPRNTSSCIQCHVRGSGWNGFASDFSFLFLRAQPVPNIVPPGN